MIQRVTTDVLIIGAGLAGSILAWRLIQAGQSVHLIHNPEITSASRVAAGLINPVTGQRLVLQSNIDTILPAARKLYEQLSTQFEKPFFFAKPMLRTLQNQKAQEAWNKRRNHPDYQDYLSAIPDSPNTIEQHNTGYLDTNSLLDSLHAYFRDQQCLTESHIDLQDIQIHDSHIQWQNIEAEKIILCQGWRTKNCSFFSYLPFQPAKGEILTLFTPNKLPEHIINQGTWLLPLQHGHFRLGATYQTQTDDESISQAGKDQLLKALALMPIEQNEVIIKDHQAGIRPNTLDKSPFLGMHPTYHNIGIFNGFGSKGSLLIPWYSKRMCEYLTRQKVLPAEADIQRFACA